MLKRKMAASLGLPLSVSTRAANHQRQHRQHRRRL
jgi:hypothetical protein